MSIQKKLLATAVVGALYMVSTSAFAQVSISDGDNDDALVYASEINRTGTGAILANTAANDLQFTVNYNFSDNEVRYARVECTNLKFNSPTVTNDSDDDLVIGAVNGTGTNAIYFSITDEDDAADAATADYVFNVDSAYTLTGTGDAVCTYRLYDQPSQAQAGGDVGLIRQSSGTFITTASGVQFDTDPNTLIADVEAADGAYTDFLNGYFIGGVQFNAVSGVLDRDGEQIALADIFAPATRFVANGNFGPFVDGYVGFCEGGEFTVNEAANQATRTNGGTSINDCFVLYPDFVTAIPAGNYTLTLDGTTNSGYTFADRTLPLGEIVRNGTELQAPLAQVPGGWLSRMVLTNTGDQARPYAIEVFGETGNVIGTDNLTGTVPAHGTVVVDLNNVLKTFTGAPRATLNVTVSAPNNEIQGLYQIVNPASGSISNHVMVRPGTN